MKWSFTYLGSNVQNGCGMDIEISSRDIQGIVSLPLPVTYLLVASEQNLDCYQDSYSHQCDPAKLAVRSGKHSSPCASH